MKTLHGNKQKCSSPTTSSPVLNLRSFSSNASKVNSSNYGFIAMIKPMAYYANIDCISRLGLRYIASYTEAKNDNFQSIAGLAGIATKCYGTWFRTYFKE